MQFNFFEMLYKNNVTMSTKKCYILSVNFLFYKRKKPQILKENQFLTILKIYGFILKESLQKINKTIFKST